MIPRDLLPAALSAIEDALQQARKRHAAQAERTERASEARRALPAGSPRAKLTTANARWKREAEERERLAVQVAALEAVQASIRTEPTCHEETR